MGQIYIHPQVKMLVVKGFPLPLQYLIHVSVIVGLGPISFNLAIFNVLYRVNIKQRLNIPFRLALPVFRNVISAEPEVDFSK